MIKGIKSVGVTLSGLVIFVVLWHIVASDFFDSKLPGPTAVTISAGEILTFSENYTHILATVRRVVFAFVIAFTISALLGVAVGSHRGLYAAFRPLIVVGLTIPAICWTAISVMFFGIGDTTAIFATVVIVSPLIITTIAGATSSLQSEFFELAHVYRMTKKQVVIDVILPQITPSVLSSARYGLTLSFKVVIIAELLGLSKGVGFQIFYWYTLFNLKMVFAWTLVFLLIMIAVEFIILRPIELRLTKWRRQ